MNKYEFFKNFEELKMPRKIRNKWNKFYIDIYRKKKKRRKSLTFKRYS